MRCKINWVAKQNGNWKLEKTPTTVGWMNLINLHKRKSKRWRIGVIRKLTIPQSEIVFFKSWKIWSAKSYSLETSKTFYIFRKYWKPLNFRRKVKSKNKLNLCLSLKPCLSKATMIQWWQMLQKNLAVVWKDPSDLHEVDNHIREWKHILFEVRLIRDKTQTSSTRLG